MSPQKKAIKLILDHIENKLGYRLETTGLPVGGGLSAEAQAAKDNSVQLLSASVSTDAAPVGKVGDFWIYSMIVDIRIAF